MKNVSVVIGANYGDEGKGLITDYLAAKDPSTIVVRFNGGSQAAHTVETPPIGLLPSKRHVFSHLGAGSFYGSATYLSEYFIINPITFRTEFNKYKLISHTEPDIFVNRDCIVTTPYDMMINQVICNINHSKNTCGLGINETMQRTFRSQYISELRLTVQDFYNKDILIKKLRYIRNDYIYNRLKELGIEENKDAQNILCLGHNVLEQFVNDIEFFLEKTKLGSSYNFRNYDNIVFEGAQGLLLDQNHENFPYVTHSNTGIKNISKILEIKPPQKVNIYYTTRCYLTRHGDGPFQDNTDLVNQEYDIIDKTNIENQYQGNFKLDFLDVDLLLKTINNDWRLNAMKNMTQNLAITCLDQVKDKITFKYQNKLEKMSTSDFINKVIDIFDMNILLTSSGTTREMIREYTN